MRKSLKIVLWAIFTLLCLGFIVKEAMGNGDFKIFLEAAKLLRENENLYNKWIDVSEGASGLYYYSPLFALLLVPFSYLPYFIPNLLWLLASVFFLYRIWVLIAEYFDLKGFGRKSKNLLLFLTLLFTIRFIHLNFGMIQMTIFLLWSMLESVHAFNNKQNIKGAAILALAINIKILPLVLIPYLVYRNKWKPVLIISIIFIALLFIPALFIGFEYNNFLLSEWWRQVNPIESEKMFGTAMGFHSLTALIPALLNETDSAIDLQRHIVNLDLKYIYIIQYSFQVSFILFTIYFLRTLPFRPARSKSHELWELSYIILLIPLIFPHQQKYAFVLILPAVAYIMYFLISLYKFDNEEYVKRKWVITVLLLVAAFILLALTSDMIVGRQLNRLSQHYKTITYGAILLLIVLTRCNPKYIERINPHAMIN